MSLTRPTLILNVTGVAGRVDVIQSTRRNVVSKSAPGSPRLRRPHNELKNAMRDFLAGRADPATIAEIKAGTIDAVGEAPASSYRSALQDERVFERVSRGVFKLRGN